MDGNEATVALSQREAALDRDFVLSVECGGPRRAAGLDRARRRRRQAVAVAFVPTFGDALTPCEVIVPRRSLGLDGGHVDRRGPQRAAALPALADPRLHASTSSASASTYESLFPESRPYDEASLAEASAHVDALRPTSAGRRFCRRCSSSWSSRGTRPAATGRRPDRRRGHEHRRRARARALARGARARLHVRHRRRREPAPGERARARRRRVGRVHPSGRTNRTEGRAPVRTTAVARTHRCRASTGAGST